MEYRRQIECGVIEFRLETLSFKNCVIWGKLLITLLSVPSSVKLL